MAEGDSPIKGNLLTEQELKRLREEVDLKRERQVRVRALILVCCLALILAVGIWFGFLFLGPEEIGSP